MRAQYLPNDEQLRDLCPKASQYTNCMIEEAETCLGRTVEEMERCSHPTFGKMLSGGRSLARDICDENSQFRQDYLASRECYKGFSIIGARHCAYEALRTADILMKLSNEPSEEEVAARKCLLETHTYTCLIMELRNSCGETAQKVFVGVFSRLKGTSSSICNSNEAAASEIRTKLFDILNIQGEVRSEVDTALDLLIKRR
ncbi:uncharacterized protein CDAR_621781 [Caerostris darwini]|uniref:Uncharacterized protein n=1 Tax=Caerostris darwini TaxID=1538125 RepID=A0AAV4P8H7_9ARAC|nr:uncharacterized protein CDAR_621781 [Caerostris darwini]